MFELKVEFGEIRLSELFEKKVKTWLDNNSEYMKQAYNQVNFFLLKTTKKMIK